MLLTGTFKRAIDNKLRIAIPKRFRDSLLTQRQKPSDAPNESGGKTKIEEESLELYVAPGTDGSLAIYTEESFSQLAAQLAEASPNGKDVRAFSRLFYSRAESAEVDRQGRIRIPAELAKLAALKEEAVLIGVRDHLEIWDSQRWQEYIFNNEAEYDDLAEKALSK